MIVLTIQSLSKVPRTPAIYALYGRRGTEEAAYVGSASKLRDRLHNHLIRRNSSVFTGERVARLNAELVGQVLWWEHPDFINSQLLLAAEAVASEVLRPVLRSSSTKAMPLPGQEFRQLAETLFRGTPSGRYVIPSLAEAIGALEELTEQFLELANRVLALERIVNVRKESGR